MTDDEPQLHYLMIETRDAAGQVDGALQIPVVVFPGRHVAGGGFAAEMSPQKLWWFSNAAMETRPT